MELDDKQSQIDFGGSVTLAFARQVLFDMAEYFDHIHQLLSESGRYSSGRDVRMDLLYGSTFITVFAYLEKMTGQVGDDLAKILHMKLRPKHLDDRSPFESTRRYLELVVEIEFPSQKNQQKLVLYRKVRNAIAHGSGLIGLKDNELKSIERLPGVQRDEDGYLKLTSEFCEAFLRYCVDYVTELEVISNEIAERAKRRVTLVTKINC